MATEPKMPHRHHAVDVTAGNRMTDQLNRAELSRISGGGAPPPPGEAPMTGAPPQR